jgi:hypothetical protein
LKKQSHAQATGEMKSASPVSDVKNNAFLKGISFEAVYRDAPLVDPHNSETSLKLGTDGHESKTSKFRHFTRHKIRCRTFLFNFE